MSNQIWFARLPSRGRGGARMSPVSREGWMVVAAFVLSMLVGASLFAWQMVVDHVAAGVILFVLFALAGSSFFLWAAYARGDTTRTVADYRAVRKGKT